MKVSKKSTVGKMDGWKGMKMSKRSVEIDMGACVHLADEREMAVRLLCVFLRSHSIVIT